MVHNNAVNRIQGAQLKSKGMVAGVSDMIYLVPGGAPILLEIKAPKGTQSKKQASWQKKTEMAGYRYEIVRGLADFQRLCASIADGSCPTSGGTETNGICSHGTEAK